jgi:hypothetical protein
MMPRPQYVYLYYAGTDKPTVYPTAHWLSSTGYEQEVGFIFFHVWNPVSGTDMPGYFWYLSFEFELIIGAGSSVPVTVVMEIRMSGVAVGRVNMLLDFNYGR